MKRFIGFGLFFSGLGIAIAAVMALGQLLDPNHSNSLREPPKKLVSVQTEEQYQRQKAAEERLRQPEQTSNPFSTEPFVDSQVTATPIPSPTPSIISSPDTITQATPSPQTAPQKVVEAPKWVSDERLVFAIQQARQIVQSNPTVGLRLTPENGGIDVFYAGRSVINTLRNENDRIVISVSNQGTATVQVVEQNLYLYVTPDGSYYVVKGNDNQPEYLNPRQNAVRVGQILERLEQDFRAIPIADPEKGQQDNQVSPTPIPTPTSTPQE